MVSATPSSNVVGLEQMPAAHFPDDISDLLEPNRPPSTSCTCRDRRRSIHPDTFATRRRSRDPTCSPPASNSSAQSHPQKLDNPPAAPAPAHLTDASPRS